MGNELEVFTDAWITYYSDLEKTEGKGETRPWVYGALYYRERIVDACRWAFQHCDGDALEIGVYGGATSARLAPLCVDYLRQLVLVDAWDDPHGQYGIDNLDEVVEKYFHPFGDTVQIIKRRSQDPEAVRLMQEHTFAFSFIDGSHHSNDVYIDLQTVLPITAGVVVMDDWFYGDIAKHTRDLAPLYGWKIAIEVPEFKEVYLLKDILRQNDNPIP